MIDTLRLTAEEALGLLERREVSSAELHGAYRRRRGERNDELHAYLRLVDYDGGTGVPIALKDVISTKGVETTAGSKILAGYTPVFDSTVAARCRAAGLPRDRQDEHRRVRDGLVDGELGLRAFPQPVGPLARAGRLGRRHGGGRVGRPGPVGPRLRHRRLDQAAVRALRQRRPAADVRHRLALRDRRVRLEPRPDRPRRRRRCATSRCSTRSSPGATRTTRPRSSSPSRSSCRASETLDGLRIGIPTQIWDLAGDRARRARLVRGGDRDGALARGRGRRCDLPLSFDYGMPCYYLIAPAEASSNLARYDGVRYGPRVDAPTYREMVERTRDAGFGDEPKRRIMLGTYALSAGYYDAYYGQAQRVRTLLIREHRDGARAFDVLATPTSPTVAFPIGDKASDPLAMYACDVMTIPSCLAGLPGLNIPSGLSEGLPVGLQLIGRQFGENTLFRAGHALEQAIGFDGVPERLPMSAAAWETVVGLEIHVQLKTRTKMFCRCAAGFGAGENTQTCPVCLGFPGALPVINRTAVEWTVKLGLALGCEIAPARRLRAEELLLPRSAEGLSDLPVRYAFLHKWQDDSPAAGGRARGRDRARAPRGGRGEDRPHGRPVGPDRRRRVLARRLQPRRHAAARDRHGARHPLGRGGEALPPAPAADGRRARHLGRGDGEGHAPRRRQRLGAPGGLRRAPHALRDQEHELVQLHRARDRGRGGAPDRDLGVGRRGAAGDVRLRRRLGDADAAALEGGGGRLPLLPGARSRAGGAARRDGRAAARRAVRAAGGADRPARAASSTSSARSCSSRAGSTASTRRPSRPAPSASRPRT